MPRASRVKIDTGQKLIAQSKGERHGIFGLEKLSNKEALEAAKEGTRRLIEGTIEVNQAKRRRNQSTDSSN